MHFLPINNNINKNHLAKQARREKADNVRNDEAQLFETDERA